MTAQEDILRRVFATPTPANLRWSSLESLLISLGATLRERAGSRVAVRLGGRIAVLHRPHPRPEASRPLVRSVRRLIEEAGLGPDPTDDDPTNP